MPRYWLGKKSPVGYSSTPSDAGYVLIFPARMGPPRQIADFVKDRSNKSSNWLGRALGACLVLSLLLIFFDGCSRADYIHQISSLSLSDVSPGQAQALSGGRLEPLVLPPYAMDARWWVMHAKQMLREGPWRVRHTATDNAPDGREVHWSSSLSWALCGMAGIWGAISGQPVEQCVAPAAIFGGPILLLPIGLLLFLLSRRAFGGLSAVFFLSALLVSYPFIRCFLAGDADHHGLVAGLVTASLLSLIAGFGPGTEPGSGRARAKGRSAGDAASQSWAVTSGLLGGAALWISAATALPVLAATIGGALLAMLISRHNQQPFVSPRYWLSWGISGCFAKDALENAEQKARSVLSGAETRGRKYLQAAETEAEEMVAKAEVEAETLFENKKREISAMATAARREGERIITEATGEVGGYRQWLASVISEAERLYKVQTQSLDQAESAIQQSRARLQSSFERLAQLQDQVLQNLNADDTLISRGPIRVTSERTKVAIEAPKKAKSTTRKPAKKAVAKKPVKKAAAKRK